MYSPKIEEELVCRLYELKQRVKRPITKLANEAIKVYLNNLTEQTNEEANDDRELSR